jgi:hypothetical protein
MRSSALSAGCPLPPERFLVLISVRGDITQWKESQTDTLHFTISGWAGIPNAGDFQLSSCNASPPSLIANIEVSSNGPPQLSFGFSLSNIHISVTARFSRRWLWRKPSSGYKNPVRTSQETHNFSATTPSRLMLCKLCGFHGGDLKEPTFRGNVSPPSSGWQERPS